MKAVAAVLLLTSPLVAPAAGADAGELDPMYPEVITPTRLKQAVQDVPASVTVISAEMIERFGIKSIPEALRLVPGFLVTKTTGSRYEVNYHGTNIRNARRLNVLIDGAPMFRPNLSEIDWTQLPVSILDVEKIEVTRGSNSAAYGPNSMMAIVNIITKHPQDVRSQVYVGQATDGKERQVFARTFLSWGETTGYLSLSGETNKGYDWNSYLNDGHDTTRTKRLTFRSNTPLEAGATLRLQASYLEGLNEVPFTSRYENFPDKKFRDYYLGAQWNKQIQADHEIQVRLSHSNQKVTQEWTACFPAFAYLPEMYALFGANPGYANTIAEGKIPRGGSATDDALAASAILAIRRLGASGLQPLCGTANQNMLETRSDVELQDTFVWSPNLRFVTGMGLRSQKATSETFLSGSASNNIYRVFGNAEYKPVPMLSANLGAYAEHDDIVGTSLAPRLALNAQLSKNQTLRLVASKGLRTPDVQEQFGNFNYTVRTFSPGPDGTTEQRFFQHSKSTGGLQSERAQSSEIGYLVTDGNGGLFDFKVFREKLTNLISAPIDVVSFQPTNTNSVILRGAESQYSFKPSRAWGGFLNYTYLDNVQASTPLERSQYSRHSGSIGLYRLLQDGWRVSAVQYGASGNGIGENHYGRLDLNASKTLHPGIDLGMTYSRLENPNVLFLTRLGRAPVESRMDSQSNIYLWLSAKY